MREAEYHNLVRAWLAESFVEIEHEVILESDRRVDFVAYTPFHSYVIEVENSWNDIHNGIGQAGHYSSETGHEPIVIVPADDVQWDEYETLQSNPLMPRIETV